MGAFEREFGPAQRSTPQPIQQATQQSTPPTPQEAKKEEAKAKKMETTADKQGKTLAVKLGATARSSGNSATCLSKALHFATHHALTLVGTPLGYIRCMEGMEALGKGWITARARQWEWLGISWRDWTVVQALLLARIQPYQSSFGYGISHCTRLLWRMMQKARRRVPQSTAAACLATTLFLQDTPVHRDPAVCLSKALHFATQHALILVGTPLNLCMEGMEVTGEDWMQQEGNELSLVFSPNRAVSIRQHNALFDCICFQISMRRRHQKHLYSAISHFTDMHRDLPTS